MKQHQLLAVAALADASPILSGLSAQQLADFREDFIDSMAPGGKGEVDEMQSICDAVLQTTEEAARPVAALRPTADGIAEEMRADAAATPLATAAAV